MESLMEYYGICAASGLACSILCIAGVTIALGFFGAPFWLWTIAIVGGSFALGLPFPVIYGLLGVCLLFVIVPLRRAIVSSGLMKAMAGIMPKISDTERTALEAGVVWAESDLFSGKPNFKKLIKEPYAKLTAEEQAFIDGPTEELCKMLDDWKINNERKLPDEVFQFIKDNGFLGMIVSKEYGGLGFSAMAHGEVIAKLAARSITACITVMVPNSLGPAELLSHFGTQKQKDKYLRDLAAGKIIPCFGLTEPQAGSDAGSITSRGELFKNDQGEICIKLNWNKRWITLAAISDVIGLAFQLYDPENLLGKGEYLGITVALVDSKTPGVTIGHRHDPLAVPFYNCPTQGKDVVVNAEDAIIGGLEKCGQGWAMLMDSLGAGRGISLPSQSVGGLKHLVRVTGAHATIRKQFGVSIGQFEGIEEPLGRIGAANYYIEAMRNYTMGALDQGIKPPVITAMCKYHATETFRDCVNDAMDVIGGAGISMGPRNTIAAGYIAAPIAITVEGANILTRTLMIFGQGALRAHPYAFKEVASIEKKDVAGFDQAFWAHIGHIVRNASRSFVLSLTGGLIGSSPVGGVASKYYRKLDWTSASFAILSDLAMGLLGGKLKFKEKITGRFADILSWMYIALATLRRFEEEGQRKEDIPLLDHTMAIAFGNIQRAFDEIFANFDVPVFGLIFKYPIRFWSRLRRIDWELSDKTSHEVAKLMQQDSEQRERLTQGIHLSQSAEDPLGRLDQAFKTVKKAEPVERKVSRAIRKRQLPKKRIALVLDEAVEKNIITADEKKLLVEVDEKRWDAIQVDSFSEDQFLNRDISTPTKTFQETRIL